MTDPHDGAPAGPLEQPVDPLAATALATPVAPDPVAPVPAPASPSPSSPAQEPAEPPTFVFFGIVAAVSLVLDVATKAWAEITLSRRNPMEPTIELIPDHLGFTLAYNPGGAWGLFQSHSEYIRRPFFLLVSLLAIAFIINLYGRLTAGQRALKWGLPLVLGGALGNLSDRIVRSNVIDFIDYQAKWIESMNRLISKVQKSWVVTDHWPTFNVADIAICVGVGLMAVDMFTSRRGPSASLPPKPPAPSAPPLGMPVSPDLGVPVTTDTTPPLKPEP
jgi:signal peptidase II